MRQFFNAAAAIAVAGLFTQAAFAAPSGLLDKTIHVSFNSRTPSDSGESYPPRSYALTIYVSTKGHVFTRWNVTAGRYGKHHDSVGGNFRIVGKKIVGIQRSGNGAAELIVNFDNNFRTCRLDSVVGTTSGQRYEWISLNGKKRVASGPRVVFGKSCSIENGNAFAQ
jgi:hypothetical protein